MRAFDLSESAVKKIIRAFNLYGIDRLIEKNAPEESRSSLVRRKKRFWKSSKNRGAPREPSGPQRPSMAILPPAKYRIECSYDTVLRLLHEKGYRLGVPQPWPKNARPLSPHRLQN
jgi:transposase